MFRPRNVQKLSEAGTREIPPKEIASRIPIGDVLQVDKIKVSLVKAGEPY
jgi:hypothetical protein